MLRVWSCNFFYSVICGTAVKAPPSGSLPVVNSVSRVARSDSGCSISPSTSQHIPQTCDSGVVRNRQGLSCRSASGSSGLAASSGCQLPRHHLLPVVFAQRSILSSNLLSSTPRARVDCIEKTQSSDKTWHYATTRGAGYTIRAANRVF